MIHSLSGGVLGDNGVYTFAKVEVEGAPRWYVAPFPVKEGDTVAVPYGAVGEMQGRVLRTEHCTAHTAPVPISRVSLSYSSSYLCISRSSALAILVISAI